jgi:hypothetical protein
MVTTPKNIAVGSVGDVRDDRARVIGAHCHPGLVEQFTVLEGELS